MTYDQAFFDQQKNGSHSSAMFVLPPIIEGVRSIKGDGLLAPLKVIDIGCGIGTWLAVANLLDCETHGIDGNEVSDVNLMIPVESLERRDLANGIDCSGYDLALCMEVAEHLPESEAENLVAGLAQARFVLFSGAHPGQGGVNHVNEQWGSWWNAKFSAHGMVGSSDIKWVNWNNENVEDFYRENMILFASSEDLELFGATPGVVDVIHPQRLGTW